MAFKYLVLACLAASSCAVAEEGFIEGLSADEILNGDFETGMEYVNDQRTIDQVIADAGTSDGAATEAGKNQEINYDMDMNMDPIQYEVAYGNLTAFAGAGITGNYWPKGIIPYRFGSRYTSSELNSIYAGMKMWMDKTCIRFVKAGSPEARSTGHSASINIYSGGGCFSGVGFRRSGYNLSLKKGGCTGTPGIAAHELGHAIGLHHEQCRTDRDQWVKIFLNDVPQSNRFNFNIMRSTSTFGQPYDYCSVMHYGATAFATRRNSYSIVPKDLNYLNTMGRMYSRSYTAVTGTDAAIVNKMYNCNKSATDTPCPKMPCGSVRGQSTATCANLRRSLG